MTVPREYLDATRDFERLLLDVRDTCMLQTTNQAYATLRAVLLVFRAHLSVRDALTFASVLPPVARAIFIDDWDLDAAPAPFPSRPELAAEVMAVRPDHNLSPSTAIPDVAAALRRAIEPAAFDRALALLPEPARLF